MLRYIHFLITFLLSSVCYGQYIEPQPLIGKSALKSMIKNHIEYPAKDLKENRSGNVEIEFTTDKEGNVIDYILIEHISTGIDSAAASLFQKILWKPATYNLVPVEGKGSFIIKYNTKQYYRLVKKRGYNIIEPPHLPLDSSNLIHSLKQLNHAPKPLFSNSKMTLNSYIYSNLIYPEAALKTGIEGDVVLQFIIEKNGLPSNIRAGEHLGGGCTGEAIRLVESIRWYPGLNKKGEAVRTSYNVKIHFKKPDGKDNYIPNQQGSGI